MSLFLYDFLEQISDDQFRLFLIDILLILDFFFGSENSICDLIGFGGYWDNICVWYELETVSLSFIGVTEPVYKFYLNPTILDTLRSLSALNYNLDRADLAYTGLGLVYSCFTFFRSTKDRYLLMFLSGVILLDFVGFS